MFNKNGKLISWSLNSESLETSTGKSDKDSFANYLLERWGLHGTFVLHSKTNENSVKSLVNFTNYIERNVGQITTQDSGFVVSNRNANIQIVDMESISANDSKLIESNFFILSRDVCPLMFNKFLTVVQPRQYHEHNYYIANCFNDNKFEDVIVRFMGGKVF